MPTFCGVYKCGARGDRDCDRSFYRIPAILIRGNHKRKELSRQRRTLWINALKRKDLTENKIKNLRVCSDHFIQGKPAGLLDKDHPDWIPSRMMGYHISRNANSAMTRYQRHSTRRQGSQNSESDEETTQESEMDDTNSTVDVNSLNEYNRISCQDQETQTELTMNDISSMFKASQDYINENRVLKERLKKVEINEESFQDDDEKVKYYTGIPQYATLLIIFELIKDSLPVGGSSVLSAFQQFLLTLMRLRLNLDFTDLAYRFNICQTTASNRFYSCLYVLSVKLKRFIIWPERDVLRSNMPPLFLEAFQNKTTVIIDCFEIPIEKPSNKLAEQQTWSNYKQRYTIKFLIGIAPQGSISFISKAWGGRTSDKYLTENSKFLEKLLPGDLVIADRGFNIKDSVGLYCAEIVLPHFLKGKKQLNAIEVEETRKIANVRIHVERVIGALRQKYSILHATVKISMLAKNYTDGSSIIDQIVTVCCGLVNFCPSVIPQAEGQGIRDAENVEDCELSPDMLCFQSEFLNI